MNSESEDEKCRTVRHLIAGRVLAEEISNQRSFESEKLQVVGDLRDIGEGGFCCVSEQMWKVSSLLRCEIFLLHLKVAVPTLAQVRWMRVEGPCQFAMGLKYIID